MSSIFPQFLCNFLSYPRQGLRYLPKASSIDEIGQKSAAHRPTTTYTLLFVSRWLVADSDLYKGSTTTLIGIGIIDSWCQALLHWNSRKTPALALVPMPIMSVQPEAILGGTTHALRLLSLGNAASN